MTGMACARAATTSGTCSSTAVETTKAAQSGPKPLPSCFMTAMPRRSSCWRKPARSPWSNARSLPLTTPPVMAWNWASALMPAPPSPA